MRKQFEFSEEDLYLAAREAEQFIRAQYPDAQTCPPHTFSPAFEADMQQLFAQLQNGTLKLSAARLGWPYYLRRSIAANMSASWTTSPRVTYTHPVDVTAMKDLRAKLKDGLKEQGIKLTYNHILMKVVAKALTEFPDINASFSNNMLTRHIHVNMGLAVAKGDGLIVPNVKNCEEKSLAQIAKETEDLIAATRSGKIAMEDMTGGTFTISSLGPYGITNFSPSINQPELAILGVCDMVDTPVVRDGQIVIRPMMNLCLTADHRVIDGVMASKFLKRICELLENPYMLLV